MFEDPIVEEVRRIRHAHAAMFNNDLDAIVDDLMRSQRESGRTYVNFPPRLLGDQPREGQPQPSNPPQVP
jgi:hypothetical protein